MTDGNLTDMVPEAMIVLLAIGLLLLVFTKLKKK